MGGSLGSHHPFTTRGACGATSLVIGKTLSRWRLGLPLYNSVRTRPKHNRNIDIHRMFLTAPGLSWLSLEHYGQMWLICWLFCVEFGTFLVQTPREWWPWGWQVLDGARGKTLTKCWWRFGKGECSDSEHCLWYVVRALNKLCIPSFVFGNRDYSMLDVTLCIYIQVTWHGTSADIPFFKNPCFQNVIKIKLSFTNTCSEPTHITRYKVVHP